MTLLKAALAAAIALAWSGSAEAADFVIRNVTVVDVEAGVNRPHMDVVVDGDRIEAVRPHRWWRRGGRSVDGRGRYLIPGLSDAHMHLANLSEPAFPMLIAMGVTSVRDLGGDERQLAAWRDASESGALLAPRIRFCGPMLEREGEYSVNHVVVDTPEAAHAIVARLVEAGVDCIKVRSFQDEATLRALADAARAANLPIFAHPLGGVDPLVVGAFNVRSIEHAFYPWPFHTLTAEQQQAIVAAFQRADIRIDPTLVAWDPARRPVSELEAEFAALTPEAAAQQFLSPSLHANWAEGVEYSRAEGRGSPGWVRAIRQAGADAGALFRAGVPLLAGTDTGAPFVPPDTALARELELLVADASLRPAEALAAATIEAARLFGVQATAGSVAPGKVADLVLLNADPLAEINAVRRIEAVVYRGVFYDGAARERLLTQARAGLAEAWRRHAVAPSLDPAP